MQKTELITVADALDAWCCIRPGGPDAARCTVSEQGELRYCVLFPPLQTRASLLTNIANALLMDAAQFTRESDSLCLALGPRVNAQVLARLRSAAAQLWGRLRRGNAYQGFSAKCTQAERLASSMKALTDIIGYAVHQNLDLGLISSLNLSDACTELGRVKRYEQTLEDACPTNALANCAALNPTYLRLRSLAKKVLAEMVQRRADCVARGWMKLQLSEVLKHAACPVQAPGEALYDYAQRFCETYLNRWRFLDLLAAGPVVNFQLRKLGEQYERETFRHPALDLLVDFSSFVVRQAAAFEDPLSTASELHDRALDCWLAQSGPLSDLTTELEKLAESQVMQAKLAIWQANYTRQPERLPRVREHHTVPHYQDAQGLVKHCLKEGLPMVQASMWMPELIEQCLADADGREALQQVDFASLLEQHPPAWPAATRVELQKRELRMAFVRTLSRQPKPVNLCWELRYAAGDYASTQDWLQAVVKRRLSQRADPLLLAEMDVLAEQLSSWRERLARRTAQFEAAELAEDWGLEGFADWLAKQAQVYEQDRLQVEAQLAHMLPESYTIPEGEHSVRLELEDTSLSVSLQRIREIGQHEAGCVLATWVFEHQDVFSFTQRQTDSEGADSRLPDIGFQMTPALLRLLVHWIHVGDLPVEIAQIYRVQLDRMMNALFVEPQLRSWQDVAHPLRKE